LARAARQHRDLRVRSRDGVHDLVDGAVAADDDEQRVPGVGRRLAEVAGKLRSDLRAVQPELPRAVLQLRPALAGRAVAGRGVDEEEGLSGANRT
jgi:hypothetical protein